ncbi:Protease-associated domain-containing protein 1 [Acipenser ruthenus]|uniref:Protease-associated domain-containing protein 1 n=1 Tax=Acipenser ruthenus TaxID=7906 RepID=A0A444UWI2_ACIRT|nr:Protease-associated domain-containing protein 1 [Acipenser ruthenus]
MIRGIQGLLFCLKVLGLVIHLPQLATGLGVNDFLYFRVLSPEDIGYIFTAAPAQDFGGVFTQLYEEIYLVLAEPPDGCAELRNAAFLEGQRVLFPLQGSPGGGSGWQGGPHR